MSLTYATLVSTIANLMATSETDSNFLQIFPSAIDYAEDRIYREGDFLAMRVTDTSNVTANARNYTLPTTFGKFQSVDQINIFTPVSTTTTRNPVLPASLDLINMLWQSDTAAASTTIPTYFAVNSQSSTGNTVVTFGSPPGAAFTAEVVGDVQPAAISVSNTTTYLSTFLPDVLVAAIMIFMTGFQKNFGSQADDPKMSQSWEQQYTTLMNSANLVEMRKKFQSQGWTSKQPAPIAATPR